MAQVLELKFNTTSGKMMTISINDPKPNLTSNDISIAMDTIINSDVFHHEGYSLKSMEQARIIERNVTEINLTT